MTALLIGIYLLIGGLFLVVTIAVSGDEGKEVFNEILERVHSLEGDRFIKTFMGMTVGLAIIAVWPAYLIYALYLSIIG